jgi:Reverse transcriptase (RNA-dependent DNA polymerase)
LELVNTFTLSPDSSSSSLISLNAAYYKNLASNVVEKFYFSYVTPIEIKNAIKSIKSTAFGCDNISIKMLLPIIDVILPSLAHIFNYALQCGIFPNLWKLALIKPLPKVSNPSTAGDFRPISLLCLLAKVLEKIVYDQFIVFINKHEILNKLQSGFRKLHSTGTALLKICEDIRCAIGKGEVTVLVLLDFSKAFDSVNHELLIAKLKSINCSDSVLKWFSAYLSVRQNKVVLPSGEATKQVKCSVPQGSVLAPLLYSLYTMDISNAFHNCKYHIYADDVQIYMHCKYADINNTIMLINEDLSRLTKWSAIHGLKLNPSKTQVIIIGKQAMNHENVNKVMMDGLELPFSKKVTNLGVIFDELFSWTYQVSSICKKVNYSLHNLYKFRSVTPHKTRVRLVNALILPLFDYCDFVMCNMDSECINRLQVAQNNAIRYIFDINRREHVTKLYVKLGWLKIKERHTFHILCMTHKILQGWAPTYLRSLFVTMGDIRTRDTRSHALYLQAPLAGRGAPEGSFSVQAYRLWNVLSPLVCNIKSVTLFRKRMLTSLLASYHTAKL